MTSKKAGHIDHPLLSAFRSASAPKLNVKHQAQEATIHYSALGKEKDDEEEEYCEMFNQASNAMETGQEVVTALEASEDLILEGETEMKSGGNASEVALDPAEGNTNNPKTGATKASESPSGTSSSSPSKSVSLPSMDKAFINLVKSFSSDLEPREGIPAPPTLRNRQLIKNLVKSLSTESTQEPTGSNRPSDSRLNLQLFKQFTQHRATSSTTDPKTAPTSPLASPDNRFSFKVSEVEARIEDTKRRLTEAISEPLHLFSKFIGDEASSIYRPKTVPSASELTSSSNINGHLENNNNNYTIKEEDDCVENDGITPDASEQVSVAESKATTKTSLPSLGLDKCSMSTLAKQEDEEFCELYSEDFDLCEDTETPLESDKDNKNGRRTSVPSCQSNTTSSKDEVKHESAYSIPYKTLLALTILTYGCFILPLPNYVVGMLLGLALGFMLAIGLIWMARPRRQDLRSLRRSKGLWNVAQVDIKEPGLFKGWMNEIYNYDPEMYHATLTHSAFVRLEGSTLRISKPNKNIARRASYSEPKPEVCYISQKIYDLTDSKVSLVPQSLARKRVWNKKYPIRIELAKQNDFISKVELDGASEENENPDGTSRGDLDRDPPTVYLFGRTGREKEEWFRRLQLASKLKSEVPRQAASLPASKSAPALAHSRNSSKSSLDEFLSSQAAKRESIASAKQKALLDYSTYMANYINTPKENSANSSPRESPHSSPGLGKKLPNSPEKQEGAVCWVNSLIGRIAWDFLRETYWADLVSKKIQMKLSKIRLPYFMNELTLTELDMGMGTPRILGASQPLVDHQGLWFDLEISYKGSFLMTLETKMNLSRLGKEGEGLEEFGKDGHRPRTYCLADSDEESSSAGSSDEDDGTENGADKNMPLGAEGYTGVHRPSKIMRFVDKITKNKYFQKATETEFIKKKIEEVSNTPLLLTVELQECKGKLAVNIPPPPTDRIWYGFRSPPLLELKARPKLGEREVTLAHVTDWIEKKLEREFQKILVMPNMDDVWLGVMRSAVDPRSDPVLTENKEPSASLDADIPTPEL